MSELEDLEDVADLRRRLGEFSRKPTAKLIRAGRKHAGNRPIPAKWRRELLVARKAAPITLSTAHDSNLLDDSMRMKASASMEAEQ